MRRITVKLPDELDAKLRHEAARRGSTIADVVREAVEAYVAGGAGRRLIAAKAGRSGSRDTARRIEGDRPARGPPITLMAGSFSSSLHKRKNAISAHISAKNEGVAPLVSRKKQNCR
jgi:predicted transcriptional regulator